MAASDAVHLPLPSPSLSPWRAAPAGTFLPTRDVLFINKSTREHSYLLARRLSRRSPECPRWRRDLRKVGTRGPWEERGGILLLSGKRSRAASTSPQPNCGPQVQGTQPRRRPINHRGEVPGLPVALLREVRTVCGQFLCVFLGGGGSGEGQGLF